jgi:hypothetical protein
LSHRPLLSYPRLSDLSSNNFSGDDVVKGVIAAPQDGDGPGSVCVEVDAAADVLTFYGTAAGDSRLDPVVFLRGDVVEYRETGPVAIPPYTSISPQDQQVIAEQFSTIFRRPFVHLARPGMLGF